VYLSPKIENALRFKNFAVKSLSVSLAAWVGTFLLIIYYFRIISPITILANLVIVPLVTVLTVTGFILILGIFFLPALAHIFGLTAGATVFLLIKSAQIFSLIPGAYFYLK
jgi:competence protein ComEC